MSQSKQWAYTIKRLPNKKRGTASGICNAGAIAVSMIAYLSLFLLGHELHIVWFFVMTAILEGIATIVFFKWVGHAAKLAKNDELHEH